jgi:hypothetical protein
MTYRFRLSLEARRSAKGKDAQQPASMGVDAPVVSADT